jgi:Na+/H+ antiporter NhaC
MSNEENKEKVIRPPSLLDALIPTITLVILLAGTIILYGDAGIEGPIQVALILASLIAMAIGLKNGHLWANMGRAAVEGIATVAYLPFCFFNWINVIISFGYALLGFQIKHLVPGAEKPTSPKEATLYGVGGQWVESTEYELAVTEG